MNSLLPLALLTTDIAQLTICGLSSLEHRFRDTRRLDTTYWLASMYPGIGYAVCMLKRDRATGTNIKA